MSHWIIRSLCLFKTMDSFSNESPLYVSQYLNSSDVASIRTIFVDKIETDDIELKM